MRLWPYILTLLLLAAAFVAGRESVENSPQGTRVVYRDRTITVRDTVRVSVPVTRIVYRTRTVVRKDTVYLPLRLTQYRIVPLRPLHITSRRAVLTVWNQDSLRWEQEVYRVPRPVWRYGIELDVRYNGRGVEVGPHGYVYYKRTGAYVVASARRIEAGIRFRIAGR